MDYKCDFCLVELKQSNAIKLTDVNHGNVNFFDILNDIFNMKMDATFGCIYCIETLKSQYDFKQKVLSHQARSHHTDQIYKVQNFIDNCNENVLVHSYSDYLLIVKNSSWHLIELFEQCKRKFIPRVVLEQITDDYCSSLLSPPNIEELLHVSIGNNQEEESDDELTQEEQDFIAKNISGRGQGQAKITCKICKKKGKSRPTIRYHIKREHLKKKWKLSKPEKWIRTKIHESKVNNKKFRCVLCESSLTEYDSRDALYSHLKAHTKHESFQTILNEEKQENENFDDFSNFDHPFGFLALL